ncbi:hypothetical protein BBK14_24385 [Parafrankia soli]|uniref:DUF2637 domain-containing protein n=1 Tax=Parafrankia soli TaxID=2599596 RepID=A0A1S1PK55_9ACTN|nr:hypothetical protein [Parafrankia soli]OHV23263.1 hypothetical protein BBK14_24385 [Parafrankia soli]
MSWAEERRADRDAARAQDRADRAAERDQDRQDAAAAAKRQREDQAADAAAKAKRQAAQDKKKKDRAAWRAQHAVELLVYPLAVVSAVMAIPAMAIYGWHLYGNPTGLVLPLLSELGVWVFAMAVLVSRRRHPERPTTMLTAGVAVFGAVAFTLNFLHGATGTGLLAGLVMGIVSVSGVVAHQLAVAAPPRSRAERAQARIERAAARRVARARRIAARRAPVALAADGTARLVYTPGLYLPARGRLATPPPPDPDAAPPAGPGADPWDAGLAELVACETDSTVPGASPVQTDADSGPELGGSGPVALLDPPSQPDSTPGADRPRPATRTDKQVRAAAKRIARRHGKPVTAEQLRRDLEIGMAQARRLRDELNAELYPKP